MSVVNSAINTKAFKWDFNLDGGLGVGSNVFSGISFAPGDVIIDIRTVLLQRITGALGPFVFFVLNFNGGGQLWGAPVSSINTMINGFYGRHGATQITYDSSDNFSTPGNLGKKLWTPFGTHLDMSVMMTSGGTFTGGKVGFVITYISTTF